MFAPCTQKQKQPALQKEGWSLVDWIMGHKPLNRHLGKEDIVTTLFFLSHSEPETTVVSAAAAPDGSGDATQHNTQDLRPSFPFRRQS